MSLHVFFVVMCDWCALSVFFCVVQRLVAL